MASLSIFTIGSLLCSSSDTLEELVASRIVQAIGGPDGLVGQVAGAIGVAILSVVHQQVGDYYLARGYGEAAAEHLALLYSFSISAALLVPAVVPALFISNRRAQQPTPATTKIP